MIRVRPFVILFFVIQLLGWADSFAQGNLYSARGYWEETTRSNYRALKQKLEKGDSLTENEKNYILDYELFLQSYFLRMSTDEQEDYARLKAQWDSTLTTAKMLPPAEIAPYEWRPKDRFSNGLYGTYYGISIIAVGEIPSPASVGIPLITAGLWMLGPAINPKKYENITRSTVRASNSGKFLGLVYGAGMGLTFAGGSDNSGKWAVGLSTVGSIALGEIAFQRQQKKGSSAGTIEMMRHYGLMIPWIGVASVASTGSENKNLYGGAVLGGGIAGLLIGNQIAKKYDYTWGDVDAIRSLTLISTGLGFAAVSGSLNNSDNRSLILVPAACTLLASVWGQNEVKGAHFTDRQGNTINFSSAGAGLIGLGIVALTNSKTAGVWIGVPSGLAFITHQILLHNYKMKNLEAGLRGDLGRQNRYSYSLQVTPENYFLNQQIPMKDLSPRAIANLQNPLVKLTIKF